MDTGTSWRSEANAQRYADHDYADFAQEFLHRNHDYQRDFADTYARIASQPAIADAEKEGLAGRWGLRFPHRSSIQPAHQPSALVIDGIVRRCRGRNRKRRHNSIAA
jgi:hypothetical protein